MNDIQHKEILNNMDNLFSKLDSIEERLNKLEKHPQTEEGDKTLGIKELMDN